ncbi:CHAD domain-containing protein [Streptomyces sp. MUM 178J]|nr:CHAD domain-containing protein [Streptomyces sp. MUM 178J]WRQ83021.1 CHAD domain-containing protein [Streptomyces sp. MUM 178J]
MIEPRSTGGGDPSGFPGLETDTAGEALARYLHAQAGDFLRSLRLHGESGSDTAATAQAALTLRMAARRIGGTLHTFRPLLDPVWADELRAELSWLSATLAQEHACTSRLSRLLDALSRLSGAVPLPPARAELPPPSPGHTEPTPPTSGHTEPTPGGAGAGGPAACTRDPAAAPRGESGDTDGAGSAAAGADAAGAPAGPRTAPETPANEAPDGKVPARPRTAPETPTGEAPDGKVPAGPRTAPETPTGEAPAGKVPAGPRTAPETPTGEAPDGTRTSGARTSPAAHPTTRTARRVVTAQADPPAASATRPPAPPLADPPAAAENHPSRGEQTASSRRAGVTSRTSAPASQASRTTTGTGSLTVGAARAGALLERQLTLARTRAHSAALQALGSSRFHAVADAVAVLASELPLGPAAGASAAEALIRPAQLAERRLLDAVAVLPLARAAHPYNAEALVHGLSAAPAGEAQDAPWHQVRQLLRLHRYAREVLHPQAADPVLGQAGRVLDRHRDAAEAAEAAATAARTPRIAPATAYALGVLHADQRHEVEAARFAFQQVWLRTPVTATVS